MSEERKLFDDGGIVVTTRRVVVGRDVYDLTTIRRASAYIDRPWGCVLVGVGSPLLLVLMMVSAKTLGLLTPALGTILLGFGGAWFAWTRMTTSELWLLIGEDIEKVEIGNLKLLRGTVAAINEAVRLSRTESYGSLRRELDEIPDL